MIITKVHIEKFRGFHNQDFEVGSMLTAIAGQNGLTLKKYTLEVKYLITASSQSLSIVHSRMQKNVGLRCKSISHSDGLNEKTVMSINYLQAWMVQ